MRPEADGPLAVRSLASGSSANCMLVTAGRAALLLDAGIGMRTLRPLLARFGLALEQLSGVLLTHEHGDHCRAAASLARRHGVPLYGTAGTLSAIAGSCGQGELVEIPAGGEAVVAGIEVRAFSVPHDAADPVGYRLSAGGAAVACATDLGEVTPAVRDSFAGASLSIIESNHDLDKLFHGPYPELLKHRIASIDGHLSNVAAAELVAELAREHGPACFWLAHLSAVNNTPRVAERQVRLRLGNVPAILEVARRDVPSVCWQAGTRAVQMGLF